MKTQPSAARQSAISRLVAHFNGPAALAKALESKPPYQQVQEWVRRGWASPMHMPALERVLPRSIKRRELFEDRVRAKAAAAMSTTKRRRAVTRKAP